MIIHDSSAYEKKKEEEKRLNRDEDELKEQFLQELRKESVSIICLASLYAKNFEEIGIDVTKKWETTQQQTDALEIAYKKGYSEGILKGMEAERELIEKTEEIRANSVNPHSVFGEDQIQRALGNVVQPTDGKHRRNCTKKRRKRK